MKRLTIAATALIFGCSYNGEERIETQSECSVAYAVQPGCEGTPNCIDTWWQTSGWNWQSVGQLLEVSANIGPNQAATITALANVSLGPSTSSFVGLIASNEESVYEVIGGEVFSHNSSKEPLDYEDWNMNVTGVFDREGDYVFTLRARTVQEDGNISLARAATLVVMVCNSEYNRYKDVKTIRDCRRNARPYWNGAFDLVDFNCRRARNVRQC